MHDILDEREEQPESRDLLILLKLIKDFESLLKALNLEEK